MRTPVRYTVAVTYIVAEAHHLSPEGSPKLRAKGGSRISAQPKLYCSMAVPSDCCGLTGHLLINEHKECCIGEGAKRMLDGLTPEIQAYLKAHPEQMTDFEPWARFVIEHGVWVSLNGQQELVLTTDDTQRFLDLLKPTDVPPEKVQKLYRAQAELVPMLVRAFEKKSDDQH